MIEVRQQLLDPPWRAEGGHWSSAKQGPGRYVSSSLSSHKEKTCPPCNAIGERVFLAFVSKKYIGLHSAHNFSPLPHEAANLRASLIAKYFDVIDPVYPMIHRESFLRDYDFFWSLTPAERPSADGALVALIFVMLAMGTQFVTLPSSDDKEQTAEFYGKTSTLVYELL